MYLGFLFLCCSLAIVHGQGQFQISYIAEQIDQYCDLRNGESSHGVSVLSRLAPRVGKAGPRGFRGYPGTPGVVNYTRVEAFIEETMEQKLNAFSETKEAIASLKNSFERLEGENTELKESIRILKQKTSPELCKVEYNEKCFWAIKDATRASSAARRLCQQEGGQAANIYDAAHFELIRKYLATVASNGDAYFTGMNYDQSTRRVTFRNGTRALEVRWYSSYPRSGSGRTVMMFDSHSSSSRGGLWNWSPENRAKGVLCEI